MVPRVGRGGCQGGVCWPLASSPTPTAAGALQGKFFGKARGLAGIRIGHSWMTTSTSRAGLGHGLGHGLREQLLSRTCLIINVEVPSNEGSAAIKRDTSVPGLTENYHFTVTGIMDGLVGCLEVVLILSAVWRFLGDQWGGCVMEGNCIQSHYLRGIVGERVFVFYSESVIEGHPGSVAPPVLLRWCQSWVHEGLWVPDVRALGGRGRACCSPRNWWLEIASQGSLLAGRQPCFRLCR